MCAVVGRGATSRGMGEFPVIGYADVRGRGDGKYRTTGVAFSRAGGLDLRWGALLVLFWLLAFTLNGIVFGILGLAVAGVGIVMLMSRTIPKPDKDPPR